MKLFMRGMCPEDREWHTLFVGNAQDCEKLKLIYELPASPFCAQFMGITETLKEAKKMRKTND
jgi:hypothetical protein